MGNTVDTYTTSVSIGRSNSDVNTWEPLMSNEAPDGWALSPAIRVDFPLRSWDQRGKSTAGITYWYPESPGYEMNEAPDGWALSPAIRVDVGSEAQHQRQAPDVEIYIRKVNGSTGDTVFHKRFKIHILDFLLNYNLPHSIATMRCLRLEGKLYFSYFIFKKHPSLLQKGRITGNLYFSA